LGRTGDGPRRRGLEAIATAHRLGAIVEGYDVRLETQEQALSLGSTFVERDSWSPSPKLIRKAQVAGMKAGAMIVDLSADGGGNCENTQPGEMTRIGQVTIVAPLKRAVAAPRGRQRALCE
jgi:H+-translocating NAD(P) transhydrogenase subunit alpha